MSSADCRGTKGVPGFHVKWKNAVGWWRIPSVDAIFLGPDPVGFTGALLFRSTCDKVLKASVVFRW